MRRREFLTTAAAAGVARAAGPSIRLGCQTRAYGSPIRDRDQLLGVLEDLASLGYQGFETNYQSLAHSFADPAPMRRQIEKRGAPLIGLHLGVGLFDPARVEKEQAHHLIISSTRMPPEALPAHCRELERAARSAAELGVRLSVHNHAHELEQEGRHLKAVLAGTDPKRSAWWSMSATPFRPLFRQTEVVRRRHQRIAAFHLRDMLRGQEVSWAACCGRRGGADG